MYLQPTRQVRGPRRGQTTRYDEPRIGTIPWFYISGAIAIYLEPWHADVFDFVQLRRNTGTEEARCRDLHLALWIPDLFMERVKNDESWSLMCPSVSPQLQTVFGSEFDALWVPKSAFLTQQVQNVGARQHQGGAYRPSKAIMGPDS